MAKQYFQDDPPAPAASSGKHYFQDTPAPVENSAALIPSALIKGVLGVIGLPSDIGAGIVTALDRIPAAVRYAGSRMDSTRSNPGGSGITWDKAYAPTAADAAADAAAKVRYRSAHPIEARISDAIKSVTPPDPTSANLTNLTNRALKALTGHELYNPRTGAGRIAESVISALPSAGIGAGRGGVNLARNLIARNGAVAAASGAGAGVAREVVGPDSPYAAPAMLLGSLAGGVPMAGIQAAVHARAPSVIMDRANNIAGKVIREASFDPDADAAALARGRPPVLNGVQPTTAQVVRTPAAQALENRVVKLGSATDAPSAGNLTHQREISDYVVASGSPLGSRASIGNMVGEAVPPQVEIPPVTSTPLDLDVPDGVQGDVSVQAKETMSAAKERLAKAEKDAWGKLGNETTLHGAPVLDDLSAHIEDLSIAANDSFSPSVKRMLAKLQEKYGSTVSAEPVTQMVGGRKYTRNGAEWLDHEGLPATKPISAALDSIHPADVSKVVPMPLHELQDLRSKVTGDAAVAFKNGHASNARDLYMFADKIGKHIENPNNINFGDATAPQAWSDAVAATRAHKAAFGEGYAQKVTADTRTGEPVIGGDAAIHDMLSGGPDAVENLKHMQQVPGMDVPALNNAVGDWVVGKITDNGTNTGLTQAQLTRKLSDPKTRAIVDAVPGLDDRLQGLVQQAADNEASIAAQRTANATTRTNNAQSAALQKAADTFSKVIRAGNPKALANYINDNRGALMDATDPANHTFVEQLYNSARTVEKIPSGAMANDRTLAALEQGNLLSLLYGRAAGAFGNSVGYEMLSQGVQAAAGVHAITGAGALLQATGAGRRLVPAVKGIISKLMLGNTREETIEILQRAMADPELARVLMQRPSPESVITLGKVLKASAKGAARQGAYAATRPAAVIPPKTPENATPDDADYDVPLLDEEPQYDVPVPRASGGRTGHAHLVDRLMQRAKAAKRASDSLTKPLLDQPDSSIVRALDVAQRAI